MNDDLEEYVPILEFFRIISEEKILYDFCDINPDSSSVVKLMDKMYLNPKDSASFSENLFGTLMAKNMLLPIVIKIFIDTEKEIKKKNVRSEALKYETKLYRYIFSKIVANNYSPNFVSYVGFARCKLKQIEGFLDEPEKLIRSLGLYYGNIFKKGNVKLSMLVTEDASNGSYFGFDLTPCLVKSFSEISEQKFIVKEYEENFEKIIFQVAYSLELMNRLQINHNDLHSSNVLVTMLPVEKDLFYRMDGKVYHIRTRFIPKIFDWDHGYSPMIGDNYFLEKKHREWPWLSNEFHRKTDLYTFICASFDDDKIKDFTMLEYYSKAQQKELEAVFTLSPEQVAAIQQIKPYIYYRPNKDDAEALYKMSVTQLELLLDSRLPDFENVTTIMFTLTGNEMMIFSGHQCRPTLMSPEFPTPKEFILKNMEKFESSEEKIYGPFVYTLPTEKEIKHIFIDSIRQEAGREKIVGKPKFKPTKSGKVKTID